MRTGNAYRHTTDERDRMVRACARVPNPADRDTLLRINHAVSDEHMPVATYRLTFLLPSAAHIDNARKL